MFITLKRIFSLTILFGLTTYGTIIRITNVEKGGKVRTVACDLPIDYQNLEITTKQTSDLLKNTSNSIFIIVKKIVY